MMLVLKKELGLNEFEREFRDELKDLPFDAIEIIFNTLCQVYDLVDETIGGIRDYLRYQMQVMSLREVIDSYGYIMDLQDLEDDELVETVKEHLNNHTYVLGLFEEDGVIYFIFDEF